jgi:hypothetical protein
MASLFSKVARFARSPQGRRAIAQAKEFANDPRKRQQAKDALSKLRGKGTGGGGGTGGGTPPSGR